MLRVPRPLNWFIWLLLAGLLLSAAAVATTGLSDHVVTADLVVVPGNTVYPDGKLSNRLKSRLDAAIEIYRSGNCQAIFVSGAVGTEGVDEAAAMRTYLIQQGIPDAAVIQDSEGFNTEATAKNAAVAMQQRGLRTALAVSQYFHVPRLRLLLRRQGVGVIGNSHARYFELRDAYSLAREVAAIATLLVRANAVNPSLEQTANGGADAFVGQLLDTRRRPSPCRLAGAS